jgi:MFS family permease
VNDCWTADERGKSFAVSSFIPLMGPALGPIIGGAMVQEVNWRWTFYVLSIFDAVVLILFIFFLPETHAQTILTSKATALRKSTGENHYTAEDLASPRFSSKLKVSLVRPIRLLATQPVIQIMALVLAYQFGILYILHSTFATMWITRYGQSPTMSGLHYFAMLIGTMIGSILGGWLTDKVWALLKKNNEGKTRPENRVPLLVPGGVMMPIGLLWYGWSAEQHLHWIMPDIVSILHIEARVLEVKR